MTGEIEYESLIYPTSLLINGTINETIINGTIEEVPEYNHFPGIAHVIILCFILFISLVMTNLLVALAVNDVKSLAKTAKHDQLISQVELINYAERTIAFIPSKLKEKLKNFCKTKVLNFDKGFKMVQEVNYADDDDSSTTQLPKQLKMELYDHCRRYWQGSLFF